MRVAAPIHVPRGRNTLENTQGGITFIPRFESTIPAIKTSSFDPFCMPGAHEGKERTSRIIEK